MSLMERAVLSIRHRPVKNSLLFLIYIGIASTFYVLFSIQNQLSNSLLYLNDALSFNQKHQIALAKSFKTLLANVTQQQQTLNHYLVLIVIFSLLFLLALQSFFLYQRKKEFQNFSLIGEKKKNLFAQILLENVLVLNVALLSLVVILSFFTRPITTQIQQLELNFIHSNQVALSVSPHQKSLNNEPSQSDNEMKVTRFNTTLPITRSQENFTVNFATTVQDYLKFILVMNAFIASSLILPTFYFVQRSNSFN